MATPCETPKAAFRAFTLIELLIVVAIIAILAAIAVPNFLEAQVRAKVSRTKADMRTVNTALEAYAVDNNKYPTAVEFSGLRYGIPSLLTTPIAYISNILLDPFGLAEPKTDDLYNSSFGGVGQYWYVTRDYYEDPLRNFAWKVSVGAPKGPLARWVLMSKGPDQYWARNPPGGPGADEIDEPLLWAYDPTNGTVSSGNVVRSGP